MDFLFTMGLVIYLIFAVIIWCVETAIIGIISNEKQYLATPSFFYEHTNMNKFGCWVVTALLCILNPFGGLYRLLRFVFTAGRENKTALEPIEKSETDKYSF